MREGCIHFHCNNHTFRKIKHSTRVEKMLPIQPTKLKRLHLFIFISVMSLYIYCHRSESQPMKLCHHSDCDTWTNRKNINIPTCTKQDTTPYSKHHGAWIGGWDVGVTWRRALSPSCHCTDPAALPATRGRASTASNAHRVPHNWHNVQPARMKPKPRPRVWNSKSRILKRRQGILRVLRNKTKSTLSQISHR